LSVRQHRGGLALVLFRGLLVWATQPQSVVPNSFMKNTTTNYVNDYVRRKGDIDEKH
jgi:hypothetical protein